jgi:hypothetical protein
MNTYTWKINSLECVKPKNNIVAKIHWEVEATNNKNTVSLNGICNIPFNNDSVFIDYNKLTQLEVMKWVKENIGIDQIGIMQIEMDNQLIALDNLSINIETEVTPLPWNV